MRVMQFFWVGLCVLGISLLHGRPAQGQRQPANQIATQLEKEQQRVLQLTDPVEFRMQVRQFYQVRDNYTPEAWDAFVAPIQNRFKHILLETEAVRTLSEVDLLRILHRAESVLTKEEKASLLADISKQRGAIGELSFLDMQVGLRAMRVLRGTKTHEAIAAPRKFMGDWLRTQDFTSLTDKQLRICMAESRLPMGPKDQERVIGGFRVEWSGQLTPSRSGAHVFSISPIDTNMEDSEHFHRQTMSVWIDNQLVIDAKPGAWDSEGAPLDLTAGTPATIRVQLKCEYSPHRRRVPVAAILSWKSPRRAKEVVPTTALTTPDGKSPGLQAECHWEVQGTERMASERVSNLDCILKDSTPCSHGDVFAQLADELLQRCKASESLQPLVGEKDPKGAYHSGSGKRLLRCLSLCTSSQRAAHLEHLLEVDIAHTANILRAAKPNLFYELARFGAEEQAIDLIGTSMQFGSDFNRSYYDLYMTGHLRGFQGNRRQYLKRSLYHEFANTLVWEHPPSFSRLEDRYLEMADGSCCLPVAYTLAYGYLVQGQMEAWIELLDSKLEDPAITGDRRVNWLIARAQAEEIRRSPARRDSLGGGRIMAGKDWLVEAQLIAESDNALLWVLRERITRLLATGQWDSARQLMQQNANPAFQAKYSKWQTTIDEMEQASVDLQKRHQVEAQQAYLTELKRRRQRGADAGADVSRYDSLIEKVTAASDTQ